MQSNNELRFQKILQLQNKQKNIRNLSIVAHVDHGKTTLTDSLLQNNQIIHKKSVGNRIMDSLKEEQERGITMKSSSISLLYNYQQKEDYLINLIDSPGHVEFGSEVSAALRLTDGALIVIDVIEGVSAQTYTVIRQSFNERVKSILVLNKIDRLITKLQLDPLDAYKHLLQIVEKVNAFLARLINSGQEEDLDKQAIKEEQELQLETKKISLEDENIQEIEEKLYFSAKRNNIIFCCALDSWGFSLKDFAQIYAKKLNCKESSLLQFLFGDYYINQKTKQVTNNPISDRQEPMFVQLILKNIWLIHDKIKEQNIAELKSMASKLNININQQKIDKSPEQLGKEIMSLWLPLDKAIFNNIIENLPSPVDAQKDRLEIISYKISQCQSSKEDVQNQFKILKKAFENCDSSDDAPVLIFIAKMINIDSKLINENKLISAQEAKGLQQSDTRRSMAFARIFSGRISRGKTVFIIGPKKEKNDIKIQNIHEFQVQHLYLMMAQDLIGVNDVPAGNVLAIGGLENIVFKTSTISSFKQCPSLTPIYIGAKGILKVVVSAEKLEENMQLREALIKLNKSDPSVSIYTEANGDQILATCGQVHLERCISDLQESLFKSKLKVSNPIVSYKETIFYSNLVKVKNLQLIKDQLMQNNNNANQGGVNNNSSQNKKKGDKSQKKNDQQSKQQQQQQNDATDSEEEEKNWKILYWQDEGQTYIDLDKEKVESDSNFRVDKKIEQDPNHYQNQRLKDPKKLNYFNKGKFIANLNTVNIMNLIYKPNMITIPTQNNKIYLTIRAVAFSFELAEWIEKNQELMKKLFQNKIKNFTDIQNFLVLFEKEVNKHIQKKRFRDLIFNNLISFGPNKCGSNLLIYKDMDPEESIIQQLKKQCLQQNGNQEQQQLINKNNTQDQQQKQIQIEEADSNSTSSRMKGYVSSKNNQIIETLLKIKPSEIKNCLIQGFELSVKSGPLCEEPMMGVCFIVEEVKTLEKVPQQNLNNSDQAKGSQKNNNNEEQKQQNSSDSQVKQPDQQQQKPNIEMSENEQLQNQNNNNNINQNNNNNINQTAINQDNSNKQTLNESQEEQKQGPENKVQETQQQQQQQQQSQGYIKDNFGPLSGQIISTMKECCLESFLGAQPRLVEGMYLCNIQSEQDHYAKEDELMEGSNLHMIKAHLPIQESSDFYKDMQIATSGRVSTQIVFDTWKIIEQDPFHIAQTQEELEKNGYNLQPNNARKLIEDVRKRKGINVEEKIVNNAESQNKKK